VTWNVEYLDPFEAWWNGLTQKEQDSVDVAVKLLMENGPNLPYPYSSDVHRSRHGNMRELRIQHEGRPYRVLYAFDPRRSAILLIGGDKTGNNRWYEQNVPKADRYYDEHLEALKREDKNNG